MCVRMCIQMIVLSIYFKVVHATVLYCVTKEKKVSKWTFAYI